LKRLLPLLLITVAGCHSGPARHRETSAVPPADRSAYFEIATASGALRGSAAPVALGRAGRIHAGAIEAARRRVAAAAPSDPQLAALKARLIAASSAALDQRADARRTAIGAVAATDSINAGLRRYAERHPAVAGLIPD